MQPETYRLAQGAEQMERFFKKPHMVADLRCGPLAKYMDLFADELSNDGYSMSIGRFHLTVVSDFSRWLELNRLEAKEVSRKLASKYMKYRDKRGLGKRADAEATINRLFEFLRRVEVISLADPDSKSEIDEIVEQFGAFLLEQRGLAPSTVDCYQRLVRNFLSFLSAKGKFDPCTLCPAKVLAFVQEQAPTLRGARGKNMMNALRSFLRFARYQEYVNIDLAVMPNTALPPAWFTCGKSLRPHSSQTLF